MAETLKEAQAANTTPVKNKAPKKSKKVAKKVSKKKPAKKQSKGKAPKAK